MVFESLDRPLSIVPPVNVWSWKLVITSLFCEIVSEDLVCFIVQALQARFQTTDNQGLNE
jgi:hypothetical protein